MATCGKTIATVVLAAALGACDTAVGPEYRGEPLLTLRGTINRAPPAGEADIAILWLTSSKEEGCTGPVAECGWSSRGHGQNLQCSRACHSELDAALEDVESCEETEELWSQCVSDCGLEAGFAVEYMLCTGGAAGERMPVTGSFPANFELDLHMPPPPEALLGDSAKGEPRAALGLVVAVKPDATDEQIEAPFQELEDDGETAGGLEETEPVPEDGEPWAPSPDYSAYVGLSETHVLLYVENGIDDNSPWGRFLKASYGPGYHLLAVVQGGKNSMDSVTAAPIGVPIHLEIAPGDELRFPHLFFPVG